MKMTTILAAMLIAGAASFATAEDMAQTMPHEIERAVDDDPSKAERAAQRAAKKAGRVARDEAQAVARAEKKAERRAEREARRGNRD